ncbi:hypothetical protein K1719_038264 [Acacia pycnantha]|nr:hypothetical protein K1719_038264 [Acacia pycnantha]
MGERKPIPLRLSVLLLLIAYSSFHMLCASDDHDDAIFYESFDQDFEGRWIVSEKDDYKGKDIDRSIFYCLGRSVKFT